MRYFHILVLFYDLQIKETFYEKFLYLFQTYSKAFNVNAVLIHKFLHIVSVKFNKFNYFKENEGFYMISFFFSWIEKLIYYCFGALRDVKKISKLLLILLEKLKGNVILFYFIFNNFFIQRKITLWKIRKWAWYYYHVVPFHTYPLESRIAWNYVWNIEISVKLRTEDNFLFKDFFWQRDLYFTKAKRLAELFLRLIKSSGGYFN